jgi:hypothetical protein
MPPSLWPVPHWHISAAKFAVSTGPRALENLRNVTHIAQLSKCPCVIIRKSSYPTIRATRSNQVRPGNRRMIRKGKGKCVRSARSNIFYSQW